MSVSSLKLMIYTKVILIRNQGIQPSLLEKLMKVYKNQEALISLLTRLVVKIIKISQRKPLLFLKTLKIFYRHFII
jgi:hypothetical protein